MKKPLKGTPNQRLRMERELRGWSQKYVGNQLGADHYYISRWERGTASPSPYYRQKLCVLFGKNAQELGLLTEESNEHDEESEEQLVATVHVERVLDSAIPPLSTGTPDLVGRDEVFSQLKERLLGGSSVGLTAMNGLPGVGKTTLAVALVHDTNVVGHFHDGMLWAGLGLQPNVPALLSRWGTLLGTPAVAAARLTSVEAWCQTIRAAIGTRRMLLVIDDAWQLEEALAFRVGGPHCSYLLTTRFPQIALQFSGEGAVVVRELGEEEGFTLLAQLAPETAASDPQAAHDLARLAGGLPLALHLMGRYLRTQAVGGQPRRIRAAIERLQATEQRLRLSEPQAPLERSPTLSAETSLSLQAIINASYQQLAPQAQAALCRLAVFPARPNSFSEEAALAVCQVPAETLDALTDAGLLEGGAPGRYTLHQTIADFARVHLTETAAFERLAAYFADFVQAHRKDYEALEQESSNTFAALQAASERGRQEDLVRCVNAFGWFLEARGLYAQAEGFLIQAEQAAQEVQDSAGLATTLLHLGRIRFNKSDYALAEATLREGLTFARGSEEDERVCQLLHRLASVVRTRGDYTLAETYLQEGLVLARQMNDQAQMSALLLAAGTNAWEQGHYSQAEAYHEEAVALARQAGDRERLCELLVNQGTVAASRGNYEQAEGYFLEALQFARQIGYRYAMMVLLGNLGAIATEQRRYPQAEGYHHEALAIARQLEYRDLIASSLLNLGQLATEQGDYGKAAEQLHEASHLARQIGRHWLLCGVLQGLGDFSLLQQQWEEAAAAFSELREIASGTNQEYEAVALFGLARVAAARKDMRAARQLGRESLRIAEAIGNRLSGQVSAWLEALPAEQQ